MLNIEVFYNGNIDRETTDIVENIKYKFGKNVNVKLYDTNETAIPEKYGILNPPVVVIDGKKVIKLSGKDSLEEIVTKAIF
ncbi:MULTISPECIES: hypothetical protein [Calditerrivibrio]|uniref:Thioredoxin-like fold domain-containing protein n=1 Tax=Calditerrivibrio nitroreducens TaxID=477976 RepID=A0A2J6WMY9_9BACT|nr:MAG: hypothetical protein C0187_03205 [Calditerrivibrio nitroreducens]